MKDATEQQGHAGDGADTGTANLPTLFLSCRSAHVCTWRLYSSPTAGWFPGFGLDCTVPGYQLGKSPQFSTASAEPACVVRKIRSKAQKSGKNRTMVTPTPPLDLQFILPSFALPVLGCVDIFL